MEGLNKCFVLNWLLKNDLKEVVLLSVEYISFQIQICNNGQIHIFAVPLENQMHKLSNIECFSYKILR